MVIVLVAGGKGDSSAYRHKVKLFKTKQEAEDYCMETTDVESKYYDVAEIIKEDTYYESDREGFE
jgi:hypothetical protein